MKKIHLALACLSLSLLSCGGAKDADKIGDAQFCLDRLPATPSASEVDACMEKIEGMDSIGAQNLRCAAGFIREGFSNGSRFIQAFDAISSGTGAANMQALMGILTFASNNTVAANYSNASSTYSSCLASGGKGSTLLASFSFLTMGLIRFFHAKDAPSCPDVPVSHASGFKYYKLDECATDATIANPMGVAQLVLPGSIDADALQVQTAVGAVIIGTYLVSCSGTSANTELCAIFQTAITNAGGTGNTRAVAVEFFKAVVPP